MKDIWKLSAIIKGCSVPFEKTLKFSENSGSVVILGGLTFVNFPLCIHLC